MSKDKDDNDHYLTKYKKPKVKLVKRKAVKRKVATIAPNRFIQYDFKSFLSHVFEYSGIEHLQTPMMYFVITIMLTFGGGEQMSREYQAKTFNDTWECWEYLSAKKVELLTPMLETYGDNLTSFEFYCESRYGEAV